jgi:site-specific recombinase XerD
MRKPQRLPPPVLKPDEMSKLLDSIDPTTPLGGRDRALYELMYATGARLGELCGMEVDDVDLDERLARIHKGKGGKQRVVPFGPVARHHLENYLRWVRPAFARKQTTRGLWLSHTGRPLPRDTIRQRLKQYMRAAGIDKRLTPHGLRHACATHLLQRRADLRHIQELLGHASVESTQVYTQVDVQNLKETLARCHPREGKTAADDGNGGLKGGT